jgi:hypothetical protein
MSQKHNSKIAVIGIDMGKNPFHVVGQDRRGALVLRQKWSRGQVEGRLANLPPCVIGMEACTGAHHRLTGHRGAGEACRFDGVKQLRERTPGQTVDVQQMIVAGIVVFVLHHQSKAITPRATEPDTSRRKPSFISSNL